ncbi:MAG: PDZ domain-containing protein [Ruminococcaceae bacterium]|nr:PDZ domain-containing protein [Oscillospiraceae bacterium]
MNKKISVGMLISLVAIACAITYVVTITVSTNMFNRLIGGVNEREEIYSKIQEIDSYVRSASYYDIDEETLLNGIVNGYVSGLEDGGAQYLTSAQAFKKMQVENGTLISAGFEAEKEESGYIVVSQIYPNSPASDLNIQVGDVITAIDGSNVLEMGAENAINALEGDESTNVRLSLQRSGETISVTATRRSFTIRSVTSTVVKGYGYIRINAFNKETDRQFISELQNLQAGGALGYVIDVRSCTGIFDPLPDMLSRFISGQLIANARYKDGTVAKFAETLGEADVKVPVVVVVNENTVGAAELFALSLRDFAAAKVVGKQTAGKGTVTETKNLSDGTAIVITAAELIPAASNTLSGGIKVDFSVDIYNQPDYSPEDVSSADPQISKAFEVLEGMKTA